MPTETNNEIRIAQEENLLGTQQTINKKLKRKKWKIAGILLTLILGGAVAGIVMNINSHNSSSFSYNNSSSVSVNSNNNNSGNTESTTMTVINHDLTDLTT